MMTGLKKRHKYNARKSIIDGMVFDSLREAREYEDLKLLLAAGEIEDLQCHPKFPIVINGKKVCTVILDFSFFLVSRQEIIYRDVKSPATQTAVSKLKKRLVEAQYNIEVEWVY